MSVVDKLDAARHSITGSNLAKIACKATSREVMGPKRKHIDYLIQCTNTDNVSIPNLADILFERCTNSSWVVVFKALCTFHNLMSYGNGRFIQYMASSTTCFSLQSFQDKSGVLGYDMSTFVRRYSGYLNEKASSYREMGYDFCRIKRGKTDGVLRTCDTTKLLKALPVLQKQVDAILEVDVKPSELSNGVINGAFVLLFKDLIRLFACYNDGIINLLEKYFDMQKKDCKAALDIYKKFVTRMDKVQDFLKTAEDVGFDKEDIPDLSKAPNSLLDALENHHLALEKGKAPSSHKPLSIPSITVPTLATEVFSQGGFETQFDDSGDVTAHKKTQLIEEEARNLEALKMGKPPAISRPVVSAPPPPQQPPQPPQPQPAATSPSDDLLQLHAAFAASVPPTSNTTAFSASSNFPPSQPFPTMPAAPVQFGTSPWGPPVSAPNAVMPSFGSGQAFPNSTGPGNDADFAEVFGSSNTVSSAPVDLLQPTVANNVAPNLVTKHQEAEDVGQGSGDLHSSLARVAKSLDNLSFHNGSTITKTTTKSQHQWAPAQPQVKTGGPNWQKHNMPARSTVPSAAAPAPTPAATPMGWGAAGAQQGIYRPAFGQPAPQPPMGPPMGAQPGMFGAGFTGQPQQPADPFGPIPGSQARF